MFSPERAERRFDSRVSASLLLNASFNKLAVMDEYPPLSLDHNVPLLTILGAPAEFVDEPTLDFDLKEEAILLRSEPPPVETEQASPLIQYIKHSDAARKYRFRVRTAGRVSSI